MSSAPPHDRLVPADKGVTPAELARLRERGTQRVYRGAERFTIGMPCGGIAAGQLYVLGDGRLGCWQIDGGTYFSGYGATNYRTYQPPQPIAQGFQLDVAHADSDDGTWTCVKLEDTAYDAIEFVGEYPRALIRYRAKDKPVPPIDVDLEVFSPFIPLDAANSAWPATVLRFTLRNRADQPLNVAFTGWLQNMAFADAKDSFLIKRRVESVQNPGLATALLDAVPREMPKPSGPAITRVLADFESEKYENWTAFGEAFGPGPSSGTHAKQQPVSGYVGDRLVNTYHEPKLDAATGRLVSEPFTIDLPYMTFLIGGGQHERKACLNLVIDGEVVRSATGRNNEKLELRAWDVRRFSGKQAQLEILDETTTGWGHINVDQIALTNTIPPEIRGYDKHALGFGSTALTLIGDGQVAWRGDVAKAADDDPVVGVVEARLTLAPGESRDVTFIVSWYFPNLHTQNGRMYANWFTDAADVARQLAPQLPGLRQKTLLFCDTYYRQTTLPWWLNARLMMPVSNLASGTAQWWRNGRFWAWEGVCCCAGTCTHVWNYAQAHAWLFPELARSARTMQDLDAGFDAASGKVGFRSDTNFAADGQAGTILKCYREHLTSADDAYLRKYWPRIKQALDYLITHDADDNGIIENDAQHNTYDINFVGPNTFVGALYIAALEAGAQMATRMDDPNAAARYAELAQRGRAWTMANLYNGEYFIQRVPDGDARPWQYGVGCLSDQVFGENWAHVLDLEYVYPRDAVVRALRAVYRYNFAPDVGSLNDVYPPERWFARAGDPGLFICTWPQGGRPPEPVRYRDEVWTGIEYQVAAGLAWEGLVDEALQIVAGIERRYDGTHHNPWNEVECGDHYARALASWGVLHALTGFHWDGPAGRLEFAPQLTPEDFACFFSTGTAWGTLRQQRDGATQRNVVEVAYGTLRLQRITLAVAESVTPTACEVKATSEQGSEDVSATLNVAPDGRVVLKFTAHVVVDAGARLEIELD